MRIVLASSSPRRREILSLLGLPFEVVHPQFEEVSSDSMHPEEEALAFSLGKAQSVPVHEDSILIGSDTLIASEGEKLGKPVDLSDAARMLAQLSGRRHDILTGVAIMGPGDQEFFSHVERVQVEMLPYSDQAIADYLRMGESLDKAGAYSIQGRGSKLIAGIRGDYLAAVGLPLRTVASHLESLGMRLPVDVEELYRKREFRNWRRIRML